MKTIVKRDGRVVTYDSGKIAMAMKKAFMASQEVKLPETEIYQICLGYASAIGEILDRKYNEPIDIEDIQNEVELMLMKLHPETARAYILYRNNRTSSRQRSDRLMRTYHNLASLEDSDLKRENANIDGNTAMGTMLKFGSEGAKAYYNTFILSEEAKSAHSRGDIHIHDLDFLTLTTTCTQIDLLRLLRGGFSTGHGSIREAGYIGTYASLAAIAIQANQNDQHGGQSIPNFDHAMAEGVMKSVRKNFVDTLAAGLRFVYGIEGIKKGLKEVLSHWDISLECLNDSLFFKDLANVVSQEFAIENDGNLFRCIESAAVITIELTDSQTRKAMVGLVHNLNTMNSRAGAQVPFSSINYGTNTTPEGRMVIKNILLATEEGLGNGETPIFPIQIFRVQKGVNYDQGDANYDLFEYACKVSAKRLFPNFSFQDAPFNMAFYDPERVETEAAYMGCRTRVVSNVYDPDNEVTYGRGNLSFTSINLPRLALETIDMLDPEFSIPSHIPQKDKMNVFYKKLDTMMALTVRQILERFKILCSKKVRNFPFLMGQGIWLGSEELGLDDSIAEVLKHGSLSIGFIGLAETLYTLTGHHHGENEESQKLGLEIVGHMRDFCDRTALEHKLNFTLLATPAEGLSGRFVGIDEKRYGTIPGVTDKAYYTNSFHIPVRFPITAYDKIRLEAPYHALTNAGHITYVEMDGDPTQNLEAFKSIIRFMFDSGIGYGAINHPIDHDTECGYNGVINDECPKCGRTESEGPAFERIRRITGYLVGTTERFNNAKQAEERDRVKHL